MYEDLGDEAELLTKQEEWIQRVADSVTDGTRIDRETALHGARWAALWLDDYNAAYLKNPPETPEEVKRIMESARTSSLERCEGLPTYPTTELLSIRVTIAGHEAFCLAFGEEANDIRQLLMPEL